MRFIRATGCLLLVVAMSSNVSAGEGSFSFSSIWSKLWGGSKPQKLSKAEEDALWRKATGTPAITSSQQRTLREFEPGGKADLGKLKKMLGIKDSDMAKARKQLDAQFSDPAKIDIEAIYRRQLDGKEGDVQKLFEMLKDKKTFRGLDGKSSGGPTR